MTEHIDKLRRLRVLQRLAFVSPNPMGEMALLRELQADSDLSPTIKRVRACIGYLSEWHLVQVIRVEGSDWVAAQISDQGIEWLAHPGNMGFDIYSPGELPEPALSNHRGRVSSVSVLPIEVKAWLDQELVTRNFSNYRDIARMLAKRGYQISKSAINRYGAKFKKEQQELRQSIEMAKAFAEVVGDDGAAMNQTLTVLAQQELMAVMREKSYIDEIKLPDLVRSIASLNRSDINTRKFKIEMAARTKALDDAANAVEKAAIKQKGMNKEQAQFWREQVLGVK